MAEQTTLEPPGYLDQWRVRTERVLDVGRGRGETPVPGCPGWSVADVADHLAMVYEHKVRVLADNAWPSPWPPEDGTLEGDPFDLLAAAGPHLADEFARHVMDEPTATFSAADQTVMFWARRMALEVAVHCRDVESALGVEPLPIPVDLAVDGVDEVLTVMLAGPWWESRVTTEHPVDAVVALQTGGHRWLCDVRARSVTMGQVQDAPALELVGEPEPLFLWLWGRAPDESVKAQGRVELQPEFRARLAECLG